MGWFPSGSSLRPQTQRKPESGFANRVDGGRDLTEKQWRTTKIAAGRCI